MSSKISFLQNILQSFHTNFSYTNNSCKTTDIIQEGGRWQTTSTAGGKPSHFPKICPEVDLIQNLELFAKEFQNLQIIISITKHNENRIHNPD